MPDIRQAAPAKLVVAAAVAPTPSLQQLAEIVAEVVCATKRLSFLAARD